MRNLQLFLAIFLSSVACDNSSEAPVQFELLNGKDLGLHFNNTLQQSQDFGVLQYMYFYNGGGVGVGDFNRDGLPDLYFTANMKENKLFLNEGNFSFRDVTALAGVAGAKGWTTGVSVVDINQDGMLDIYVSQMGDYLHIQGNNQLYVCQRIENGVPFFEEQASYYGLDLVSFSTQAAFFDYDLDGDLDMFQLNHSLHQNGTFGQRKAFEEQHPTAGDKLMRNDHGVFIDVTAESKIYSTAIGYGLGIATADINLDGWPDIYVGNDFHENDYLYLNNQDGTFTETLTRQMRHTSRFSMGVDIGDINNDAFNDIISLDMLPYDAFILKSSLGEDSYSIFRFKLRYGYHPQFARNNLQLNTGNNSFKEIGMFANVHATDWSWSSLFLDFDHDGYKDLFIANGIPHRMNDIDYVNYKTGNQDLKFKALNNELTAKDLALIEDVPQIKLPNKFFRNTKNLQFQDIQARIKNSVNTFSNGAVYADLDSDGDLDIIVNNIDDSPYVYKNKTIENNEANQNYLSLSFRGSPKNVNGIGLRIVVFKGNSKITYENFPVRGYQSSVQSGVHIGIGDTASVDSILVIWPDHSYESLEVNQYNTKMLVTWQEGLPLFDFTILRAKNKPVHKFVEIAGAAGIDFQHKENDFIEFNREGLIPYMVSAEGPAIAVGDVNGDGRDDVFLGNSKRRKSALYIQNGKGFFKNLTPQSIIQDSVFEDVDAVFVDIENDGDLDLIIAAGGNEYRATDEPMKQRAYLNDGKGNFTRKDVFPEAHLTASCVLPADFNGDGLVDFFFGARALPWNYGLVPQSYLFENKGESVFEDVTKKYQADFSNIGLVKNGVWSDIDGDADADLILAVEWQAIQVFINHGDYFEKQAIDHRTGWWNFVLPHDFDGDGDVDILAGNLGQNARFKPTAEKPLRLYVNDFDDNGQVEQILTYYVDDREIPFANHTELTKQMVSLKKKYLLSKDLASASLDEIFGEQKLKKSLLWEVNTLQSGYFENTGDMHFRFHALPDELQFSTLNAALLADINADAKQEVLLGGNFIRSNIEMGWYNANAGNVLFVETNAIIDVQPFGNLEILGQVRRIRQVKVGNQINFILAKNNEPVQMLHVNN